MPKLKTRKSVSKRFKLSKKGKAKSRRAFTGHLLTSKSRKRKRSHNQKIVLNTKESKKIKEMLPYS